MGWVEDFDLRQRLHDRMSSDPGLKAFVTKLVESDEGTMRVSVGADERAKAIGALDGFFAGADVELDGQRVPRYRSFREAYVDLTGDEQISGRLPSRPAGKLGISVENIGAAAVPMLEAIDEGGKLRLVEAGELQVSTWAQILGDSVTRAMLREYRNPALNEWKLLADIVPVKDFRTQRRMRFGGYADLATVAELGAYADMTTPGDEEATYAVAKKGGTETISLEAIVNDDVGAIRRIPVSLGRAAARTLFKAVMLTNFSANPTCTYDSVALFHASHGNLGSTALSVASLLAARISMFEQTDMSTNEQLSIVPRHLWVPIELEQTAYELLRSDRKAGTADNDANYVGSFGIDYHSVPFFTDANNWFLTADRADIPVLEVGFIGNEEPEIFTQDLPNVGSMFTNDTITLKVKHVWGIAVTDHRGAFGAVVA